MVACPQFLLFNNLSCSPLLLSLDNVGPSMTLNCEVIKHTMVMIPIQHAPPLLLSPDNVGPGMALYRDHNVHVT